MSGATWLGGPTNRCWYGRFDMSSCAPGDWRGLGSRLMPSPVVTCLLAEPQPMLTFFIRPPRPWPGNPEECRSAVVLGCCTPATLFIPKEFACVFGPRNLALFWFSPIRFWLLCCWTWPIQELGRHSVPIPYLRSDGVIFEPDPLGRWQDMDWMSFSVPLLEDWEGFWPIEISRSKKSYVSRQHVHFCIQHFRLIRTSRYLWRCFPAELPPSLWTACNQAAVLWDDDWTDRVHCLCPWKGRQSREYKWRDK